MASVQAATVSGGLLSIFLCQLQLKMASIFFHHVTFIKCHKEKNKDGNKNFTHVSGNLLIKKQSKGELEKKNQFPALLIEISWNMKVSDLNSNPVPFFVLLAFPVQ